MKLFKLHKSNGLPQVHKGFMIKSFCKKVSQLRFCANMCKCDNIFFHKISNKMMPNVYVFGPRMLNRILGYVDGTGVITVYGHTILIYPIITQHLS